MEAGEKLPVSERRAQLHGMWSSVAAGWDEHAVFIDARGSGVTDRLLALTAPQPGERVLELGCGPGGVGIAAAAYVGESGEVVLSDVAPAMVAIAAARVDELGLSNVGTRVLDLEEIDEPDASYDVVVCREAIDARRRPGSCRARDPARAAPRRTGRVDGLGPARTQPVARCRLRLGHRRSSARRCRHLACRGRSRSTTQAGWRRCSSTPGLPMSR